MQRRASLWTIAQLFDFQFPVVTCGDQPPDLRQARAQADAVRELVRPEAPAGQGDDAGAVLVAGILELVAVAAHDEIRDAIVAGGVIDNRVHGFAHGHALARGRSAARRDVVRPPAPDPAPL